MTFCWNHRRELHLQTLKSNGTQSEVYTEVNQCFHRQRHTLQTLSLFLLLSIYLALWESLSVDMTTDRRCRASYSDDITTGAKPIPKKAPHHLLSFSLSFSFSGTYWSGILITDAKRTWKRGGKRWGDEMKKRRRREECKRREGERRIATLTSELLPCPLSPLSCLKWSVCSILSDFGINHRHTHVESICWIHFCKENVKSFCILCEFLWLGLPTRICFLSMVNKIHDGQVWNSSFISKNIQNDKVRLALPLLLMTWTLRKQQWGSFYLRDETIDCIKRWT